MKRIFYYGISVLIIIISGCAQIGSLTGGEKDTDPPVFEKGQPESKSLNFKGDKIILEFNEFFVLNNLNSVFLSSPFISEIPDFNIKRKKLAVKFNEELHDSTTYTLWFGDAVEDYHENNPLKNFKFVFSTGPQLDTFEISGVIFDAEKLKGESDMFVMLYNSYNDSTPINQKPYYITKSDTSGRFKIDYIKTGKYRLFALKDQDGNFNFNLPNEKIAFIDSFIIPKVKTEIQIDSLKAGTVLYIDEDIEGDTVKSDTVIITEKHIYSPGNIKLFAFIEDKQRQYVLNSSRELKGKCTFEFNKPTDSILIDGINFQLNEKNSFREKQDSARKVIFWLKDENIYNRDTLKFEVSYYNKDSLENYEKETDTLQFIFNVEADSIKKFVGFVDLKQEQDSFSNYCIEAENPINYFDSSFIKLYKLYDTLVVDTKKQELLKSIRPAPGKLFFSIRRPYVNKFDIEILNIGVLSGSYEKTYSESDTLLECNITDEQIYRKDTLKIAVHYDNDFFLGQTQKFTDTVVMPLVKQALLSMERPAPDTLILKFKKELSDETDISLINYEFSDWYKVIDQAKPEELHLQIKENEVIDEDTVMLTIRTNDYDNTLGDKIDYEYSKNAIYKRKKQNLNSYSRPNRNTFYFALNKPLETEINITILNYTGKKEWFKAELNNTKDTINYTVIPNFLINRDTLKLAVNYEVRISKNIYELKFDTINLIYRKFKRVGRKKGKQSGQNTNTNTNTADKRKVSIEIPLNYTLKKDSVSERKLWIINPWITGTDYILKLDSGSIIDIYNNKSINKEAKFNVRKKDYYARILLNLSNVKRISDNDFYSENDTVSVDSVMYSVLPEGSLIINLFDNEGVLTDQKVVQKDSLLVFDHLIPGSYSLKLIYDKNNNSEWDTGNYLKNIQPERVIIYSKEITLKSNWDNEVEWKISPPEK